MGIPMKKSTKSKSEDRKKIEKGSHGNKGQNKKKSIESAASTRDKKKAKAKNRNNSKEKYSKKSVSKELNKKKTIAKDDHKKNDFKRETLLISNNNNKRESESFFSCLCCCGNEDEWQNELLLEEERRLAEKKKRLAEEEKKKKEEEEKKKKKEEEERKKKEEEEKRKKEEEEEKRKKEIEEKEKQRSIEEQREIERKFAEEEKQRIETEEMQKKQTHLVKVEVKAKPVARKSQIQFRTSAAAPPPPPASACYGPPPDVKSTNVPLSEGAYLIYRDENGGQLEIQYSKKPISGKGVLAFIGSDNIPSFYFKKLDGKQIVLKDVSKLISSSFIKDRIPYYEKWLEFIKLQTTLQGTLYLLPAYNAEPPAKVDVVFFNSEQNKLQYAEIEKPLKMWGDSVFVVQHGLDMLKKEQDPKAILSFVASFGALHCL